MSWWLRLRRSDAPPTRGLEPGWPAGASARGLRGKPATSKTAAHRSLSAPCARPRRAARRVGRCTRRTAGRRKDPPHRALERERKRTPPGGAHRADRVRAEPVQCFRPLVRRCACRVRERGHRLPALAPLEAGGSARGTRALDRVAQRHDATPVQIAIAWLLARSPVMVPIPGTSSLPHLEENVAAARLKLSKDDLKELS